MTPSPRHLPHSLEAEVQLLACVFVDSRVVLAQCIAAGITPASFYDSKHGSVFALMLDLHRRDKPVEVFTIAEELKSTQQLDSIGGYPFVLQISGKSATTAQVAYCIETVRALHLRRGLIRAASETIERVTAHTGSADELLGEQRARHEAFIANYARHARKPVGFTVWGVADFEKHLPALDNVILGEANGSRYWHDKQVALLLGPGGVGKSRLNLQLAISQILGWEFIGFQTFGPPRRWLVMGNENSVERCKKELAKMLSGASTEERVLVAENLHLQALVDDSADSLSLDDPRAVALWKETAAIHKPDILTVDPWEAVISGGDCNDAAATRESVRVLRSIFSPHSQRFSMIIVHHAREGAEAARKAEGFDAGAFAKGSKTLRSIARFGINVAPEDPDDGGRVVLACGKINDGRKFSTRGAVLDEGTFTYALNSGFDVVAWRADVEGKQDGRSCCVRDVVTCVEAGLRKTGEIVNQVKDDTGAGARTVKNRLKEALDLGYLKQETHGVYSLGKREL